MGSWNPNYQSSEEAPSSIGVPSCIDVCGPSERRRNRDFIRNGRIAADLLQPDRDLEVRRRERVHASGVGYGRYTTSDRVRRSRSPRATYNAIRLFRFASGLHCAMGPVHRVKCEMSSDLDL